MKGVDALLASVLIIIISITAIFLALQLGGPTTKKTQEILLMQEGQSNLISVDSAVRSVLAEGEGSVRVLRFSISGGEYEINNSTNSIQFSMESESQLIAEGVSKVENGINFTSSGGTVYLNLTYDDVQIVGEGNFGRGYQTLTVRNDGFNETTQKQMVYISMNPVAPITIFTNQYNQTKTLVIEGTNITSPLSLNDLGVNTYDILEGSEYGGQLNYSQRETVNITGFNTTSADFTNLMDNQNYNITSTVGQPSGPAVGQYNQTQTTVIVGSNTTSASYLNANDGQTYNITEGGATLIQSNASSDLQSGTAQNKISSTQTWYNLILNETNGGNVGDSYISSYSTTSNYGASASIYVQSGTNATEARSNRRMWFLWNLNAIPAGSTITKANISVYKTAGTTSRTLAAWNTTSGWTEGGITWSNQPTASVQQSSIASSTTAAIWQNWNVTNAAISQYSQANKNMSIMIRDNTEGAGTTRTETFSSKEGVTASQRPQLNVTYYNWTTYTDSDTGYATYNNVYSGNVLPVITNISVTLNVSAYNKTGSNGKSSPPDLWLEVWNGSAWSNVGNMTIAGTGNDTAYVPDQNNIYNWWQNNLTQRNIRIRGRYFDTNVTAWDEINYTDVWVKIDSRGTAYRTEVEHSATGVSWPGVLNSINISLSFSTNVTSDFNLIIYNFASGSWNYTACQNGTANANNLYNWWCNITANPSIYNSSNGRVTVRLNGTAHVGSALIREDYVQYYVGYTAAPKYANMSVEQNSSPISESSSEIAKINVTALLKTNISSGIPFVLYIYNFSSTLWEQCSQSSVNTSYSKMECIRTTRFSDYISSDSKIRIRLNSSGDISTHQMMEDYLAYQITKQNQYRMEVESNATKISLSGVLYGISASLNLSTNSTNSPSFTLSIYNFTSKGWESCENFNPSANLWYMHWCNMTINPSNYISGGTIRIRLNETSHQNFAEVKEDYIQYYVTYTQ